jgi:integrase
LPRSRLELLLQEPRLRAPAELLRKRHIGAVAVHQRLKRRRSLLRWDADGDVRLHDLRHGFAVALLRAGVNVKVVAEALGHSRASFTLDTYMHVLPGMGEQVASAIETALGGSADG